MKARPKSVTAVSLRFTLIGRWGWTALALPLVFTAFGEADVNVILDRWLAAQANLKTWTADCVQTRSLKTLAQPLVTTGRVWFAAPDRFRWELGQPAQTLAVRRGDELWISYPRLKRTEHHDLSAKQTGPWRDALALLEAGFPRTRQLLDRQFKVTRTAGSNEVWRLLLQPKSAQARRFIVEVGVTLGTNECALLATELTFADGSKMRNDFTNALVNPSLDKSLFAPRIDAGFTVTEPLKQ